MIQDGYKFRQIHLGMPKSCCKVNRATPSLADAIGCRAQVFVGTLLCSTITAKFWLIPFIVLMDISENKQYKISHGLKDII